MKFSPRFLDEIRARVRLSDLIGQSVKLVRNGREFKGLCPFHSERTPSFTVNDDKGFGHCFGCGAHHDAFSWVQEVRGVEFPLAVEELADLVGLPMPEGWKRSGAPRTPQRRRAPAPVVVRGLSDEDRAARERDQRAKAYALWTAGRPVAGSLVEAYLGARGISTETSTRLQGVRFHPALPFWWTPPEGGRPEKLGAWPAMIAAIVDGAGRFQALHQTWLADDGSDKRVIVAPDGAAQPAKKVKGAAQGGAIRLTPLPEGVTSMAAGEGIETCASVLQALRFAVPVWCLYSLGNLGGAGLGQGAPRPARRGKRLPSVAPDPERPAWRVPPGIRDFTWLEDADSKDPHNADALVRRAAARFAGWGVAFRRARPAQGQDFNDMIRGTAA